ncbi:MAG: hypothetical protein ACRC67_33295 [Inquilinus sp.]|uniref:hypothetical protein n=1 Tax=Inquilinus sp. TaxID=1932117 RepID=UPI003F3E0A17
MTRSNRPEVRNPVLALPAMDRFRLLDAAQRQAVEGLLRDISRHAAAQAEHCWRRKKAPMAVYWKVVSVYAKHAARAIAKMGRPE